MADIPPDPACAPVPIAGARLDVLDARGQGVATAVTDADGRFSLGLPPGEYVVVPQPVRGMRRTPKPTRAVLQPGPLAGPGITILYDTGVR